MKTSTVTKEINKVIRGTKFITKKTSADARKEIMVGIIDTKKYLKKHPCFSRITFDRTWMVSKGKAKVHVEIYRGIKEVKINGITCRTRIPR